VQFGPRPAGQGAAPRGAESAPAAPAVKEEAIDYPAEDINPDDIPF